MSAGQVVMEAKIGKTTWQKSIESILWGFSVFTMLCVFVPWLPMMPEPGLDPSWMLGMNQALAQGLIFGRDIVFTFGPYSAVYTERYHPATDHLMLFGCAWLALGWLASINYLTKQSRWLAAAAALAALMFLPRDGLFFSSCLLPALLVYRLYFLPDRMGHAGILERLGLALAFLPLGLLPLVKVSMLPAALLALTTGASMLLYRRRWIELLITLCLPSLAMMLFWLLAHQPPAALIDYLASTGAVISGYAEAMKRWDDLQMPLVYLAGCAMLGALILWRGPRGWLHRTALLLLAAAPLFISFKAGFVRQELGPRELSAQGMLLLTVLMLLPLLASRLAWSMLALTFVVCLYSTSTSLGSPTNMLAEWRLHYLQAYQGIYTRIFASQALSQEYSRALDLIRKNHPLPALKGSVDIYSYGQADLIASGNHWSPRPVIQSYASYNESLLNRNAEHLTGNNAPDHLLFSIQYIDGKYPSLEDGASWPVMFSQYQAERYFDGILHLSKRQEPLKLKRGPKLQSHHKLGEQILLPDGSALLARIRLQPTLFGKLADVLFKTVSPVIEITLKDGSQRNYQLISRMASSDFLLSPEVTSTKSFAYLASGDAWLTDGYKVTSFRIVIPDVPAANLMWQQEFELELQSLELPQDARSSRVFSEDYAQPTALEINGRAACPGGIDILQFQPDTNSTRRVVVNGWLAGNTDIGDAADALYLQLIDEHGSRLIYPAQVFARPDVNRHFHQPQMGPVGYQAIIDASAMHGEFELSILRQYQGRLEQCSNTTRSISFNKVSGT